MKVEIRNSSWSALVEATEDERAWLDAWATAHERRYHGDGDGRVRMLHPVSGLIPTGLALLAARASRAAGVTIDLLDQRGAPPCAPDSQADLGWLRPYQQAAVAAVVRAGRGLVKAPTGSGKTEVFVALTRALPCEWLLCVHRADLVTQAAERYARRTGERAGTFVSGRWSRGSANVTVATFQSLARALAKPKSATDARALLGGVQALAVDEVHAQPAASFYRVTMAMRDAYFRVGLSGTPLDRGPVDVLRTVGAIGPLVYKIPASVLVEAGVLARPVVRMLPCRQEGRTDVSWRAVYEQLVVHSRARNDILERAVEMAQRPTLLFVDEIAHGVEMVRRLERAGVRVAMVDGGNHGAHGNLTRALVEARLDVLVATVVWQEGIDIPELASVVMGAGKASVVGALQRIGRGMRTAQGKEGFEVWDIADQGQGWLERHARARARAYKREGHEVLHGWP